MVENIFIRLLKHMRRIGKGNVEAHLDMIKTSICLYGNARVRPINLCEYNRLIIKIKHTILYFVI